MKIKYRVTRTSRQGPDSREFAVKGPAFAFAKRHARVAPWNYRAVDIIECRKVRGKWQDMMIWMVAKNGFVRMKLPEAA